MSGSAVVERTGPLCTIQDLGRMRGRRMGIAPGGAMDQRACLWANHLLANDPRAAMLEITLGGASLRFSGDALVALTGADCAGQLNGVPIRPWTSFRVADGQRLEFDYSTTGMRAYLAFAGGLSAPRMFGSASVVVREGLPGRLGSPIQKGGRIEWEDDGAGRIVRHAPRGSAPEPPPVLDLPLYKGYDWARFSDADRRRLLEAEWLVDPASDRVATRLEGPRLESGPTVLDSVPMVDGTVQVPGDGRPLIFMRDRPTIGGYPKVGSVDPIALDALSQARPGTAVRFTVADRADGVSAIRKRLDYFGLTGD